MALKHIAIVGATGHIAKGLVANFYKKRHLYKISLFARSVERINDFCESENIDIDQNDILELNKLKNCNQHFDALVNCIGVGTPAKVKSVSSDILELTEKYDNHCLNYLLENPTSLYINMSSGVVYGKNFSNPATNVASFLINVNEISLGDYYALAKVYSEAKHRARTDLNIVDLRIFSYFSRFIDRNAGYLITEILNALDEKTVFRTTPENIVRDYVHPDDLFFLIEGCIKKGKINDFFDVYSAAPLSKFALLDHLTKTLGLVYEVDQEAAFINATGIKSFYYSQNKKAEMIFDYKPRYNSLETIEMEIRTFFEKTSA